MKHHEYYKLGIGTFVRDLCDEFGKIGKIVDAIGSMDDLIERNTKIIEECERLSASIYQRLIVDCPCDFVPLENIIASCRTGLNPRQNFKLGHGSNYYVTIKNMTGSDVVLNDDCDKVDDKAIAKIESRSRLDSGDVLFSGIGTIGRFYLIYEKPTNWNISESVFVFSPSRTISPEFLYLTVSSKDFIDFANANSSGAAQKGIRMADLKAHKVPFPRQKEKLAEFNRSVSVLLLKAHLKRLQNSRLKKVKQLLLYKYFGSIS